MVRTPSPAAAGWGIRAARAAALAQAVMLVVLAVVLLVIASRERTPTCSMCWSKGTVPTFAAVGCLFFAFIYAAMALALHHESRGQWVMLAVTEALLPVGVLGVHVVGGSWSFSTPGLLGWVPNLAILALLMTPSALRSAWARQTA